MVCRACELQADAKIPDYSAALEDLCGYRFVKKWTPMPGYIHANAIVRT